MTRKEKRQRMQILRDQIDNNIINNLDTYASSGNKQCTGQGLTNAIEGAVNVMLVRKLKIAAFMPDHQYRSLIMDRATLIAEKMNVILDQALKEGLVEKI